MLALMLLLAMRGEAQMDAMDAWFRCLSRTSRQAHASGVDTEDFRRLAQHVCKAEEAEFRRLSVPLLVENGRSPTQAAAEAEDMARSAREDMVSFYIRLQALPSKLPSNR